MTITVIVLLAIVALELGILLWALARPLLALARIAEATAGVAEAVDTVAERWVAPTSGEVIAEAGARFADSLRSAQDG